MISTSPRTKILLDIHKYTHVDKKDYLKKKYNTKIILDNRIRRLLTNNEIIFKKDKSMYEALRTGFSYAKGDYLCWINSDDYLIEKNSIKNSMDY